MNHFFKFFIILAATIAFFSCSDEFLQEKLTISGVATSAVIISPEWEAGDYEFKCEGIKDADFTIISKPEWLTLDSKTGKFTDSIATIHASATAEPRFSNTGIFADQMIVSTGSKQYAVPVYYITEGNPAVEVNSHFEVAYSNSSNQLTISNEGEGILLWDIVSLPDWLTIDMSQFDPATIMLAKGFQALVPFMLNIQAAVQNNMNGTMILKTNDKDHPLIEIAVSANMGTPNLSFNNLQMVFGTSETIKTSQISNYGNGILVWKLEGLPEWLSASSTGGMIMPYNSTDNLTFTCNRTNLQPGLNAATFYLKTNDPDQPSLAVTVTVRIPGISPNIKALEGNIFDVAFDKSANTLYYVTGLPNKLVAYDVTNRTVLHELALTKAPTCLAIDEDFKQALIGHGGAISTVDLSTFQAGKTYELNTTVYDIEWAKDNWFCYTNNNSNTNLLWINSGTGETYQTPASVNYSPIGTASLKKVPNQPYIIASRRDVSPSGIYVFDLDTKKVKSYAHASIGNSWFFNQGELMATGTSSIIRTSVVSNSTGFQLDNPSAIGQLKTGEFATATWWFDHCAANHSIWTIFSYYTGSYYPPQKGVIYRFEDNDYTLVKTYSYDYMYQPEGEKAPFEVEARYVFSNSAGTEVSVLRKGASNNTWSVEFIPVQ